MQGLFEEMGWGAYMGFHERLDTALNWTEKNRRFFFTKVCQKPYSKRQWVATNRDISFGLRHQRQHNM